LLLEIAGISGNWKALTHRYINSTHETNINVEGDPLYQYLISLLGPFVPTLSSNHNEATRFVEESIGDSLRDLFLSVRKLNQNLAEGITSCVLTPILVDPNFPCDLFAMENGTGGGVGKSSSDALLVLCTMGLGLKRRIRRDDGVINENIPILPTVALRGIIDILPHVSSVIHHDTSSLRF
jgi:hypothetical protein